MNRIHNSFSLANEKRVERIKSELCATCIETVLISFQLIEFI